MKNKLIGLDPARFRLNVCATRVESLLKGEPIEPPETGTSYAPITVRAWLGNNEVSVADVECMDMCFWDIDKKNVHHADQSKSGLPDHIVYPSWIRIARQKLSGTLLAQEEPEIIGKWPLLLEKTLIDDKSSKAHNRIQRYFPIPIFVTKMIDTTSLLSNTHPGASATSARMVLQFRYGTPIPMITLFV